MNTTTTMKPSDALALRKAATKLAHAAYLYGERGQWLIISTLLEDAQMALKLAQAGMNGKLDGAASFLQMRSRAWKRHDGDAAASGAVDAYQIILLTLELYISTTQEKTT